MTKPSIEKMVNYIDGYISNYQDMHESLQLMCMQTNRNDDLRLCAEELTMLQSIREELISRETRGD